MKDTAEAISRSHGTVPEAPSYGKPCGPLRPPLRPREHVVAVPIVRKAAPSKLDCVMGECSDRLRREFAHEIEQDPRGFKKQAVNLLKRSLPPFSGRPSEESVTKTMQLRKQGHPWREIYPIVIPNYGRLDPDVRRLAEGNLRSACRSRRNTERRKRQGRLSAETTPSANASLDPDHSSSPQSG